MRKLAEFRVPGKVSDLARWQDRLWIAQASAELVCLSEQPRFLPIEAEHLLVGEEFALALGPSQGEARKRPVHRLGERIESLGFHSLDGWEQHPVGNLWLTLAGDEVRLLRVTESGLELLYRHESFLPTSVSRCRRGVWLETTSIGASHYELLSEQLEFLEQGDLSSPPMQFPPESILRAIRNPDLPQPLFAIHGSHFQPDLQKPRHRLVTLDGTSWAELQGRPRGLQVSGGLVLLWSEYGEGTRLDLFGANAERLATHVLPDSREVVTRIAGLDILVGDEHGQVLVLSA